MVGCWSRTLKVQGTMRVLRWVSLLRVLLQPWLPDLEVWVPRDARPQGCSFPVGLFPQGCLAGATALHQGSLEGAVVAPWSIAWASHSY